MAIIKIEPIETTTAGGIKATLSGIDPTSSDCIIGTLGREHRSSARWDIYGICRDNPQDCNFDIHNDDFQDIAQTIKAITR